MDKEAIENRFLFAVLRWHSNEVADETRRRVSSSGGGGRSVNFADTNNVRNTFGKIKHTELQEMMLHFTSKPLP